MTLLDAIKRKHIERRLFLDKTLGDGGLKSFEEYKYIVGQIKGMADLMAEIEDMVRRSDQDALDDTGG